ncbi:MAG: ATP synthase F1 subunit gamma [Actinobacteria bacterium]|nr:ATP synthase F1 subunit gamma [Actinomycetota bacterium]
MPGAKERTLRRRIHSVESTKKITRAMELIASSQIAKAQNRLSAARPYINAMEKTVREALSDSEGRRSKMAGGSGGLTVDSVGDSQSGVVTALVVIVADRGLCGGYNSSVLRAAERQMAQGEKEGNSYILICIGRKGGTYFRFRGREATQVFSGMTDRPNFDNATAVAKTITGLFLDGKVETVDVVSTRFHSATRQYVEVRRLLPVRADDSSSDASETKLGFYDFEPEVDNLLDEILPVYIRTHIYAALVEASVSEHTARQRAMKAATENAEELITNLTRIMNRARQDAVTTEIMEIVSGAEALKKGREQFVVPSS